MPRAIIIGSGVAGPATALFLQRAGWEVEIFEAAQEPDGYAGLFLNLATNGLAVLDQLGLREELVAAGHPAPEMTMWSSSGRALGTVPNGPAREPERGSVVVRRGILHQALRRAAQEAGIPITFGARLEQIEETHAAVRAFFADGRTAAGDVLVGADGVGSPTRRHIDPHAPDPAYSGLVGLGGFAHVPGLAPTPGAQHMLFGRRSFFGWLVRDDGEVYWFANITHPAADRAAVRNVSAEEWLAELRELHAGDPHPVPLILEHATGDVGGYPIDDLAHVPKWSSGRVVGVGDAVHATSPSAGQGASLALEDAITLARCLRDIPDRSAAFAEYQRLRQPRAEAVVGYAQAINRHKRVTKSRLGIAIRDAMLPMFLRKARDDTRNDWLYNHQVEWDVPAVGHRSGNSAR
ncbi:FAD-dependent oxidoreductase [Microbacterium sp. LWH3-1.2]|uniref:FAD-dependent oxidoreductase n=1 Tax=Microbacterium sp. LWH3-1.2 TaxID=3135256 RepID=UPI003438E351